MKKAVILSRVSTDAQDLVQQTNAVVERCIYDGYLKKNIIIVEDKESAVKLDEEHRLGLIELKDYIESDHSIDCVYAYEISRIGRRPEVNYSIRNFLKEHRVQLIILNPSIRLFNENFEYNETDNMLFGIFNSMAENEGFIRKARLRRGKERSKELGKWYAGKATFGYVRNPKTGFLVINEPEAILVRRIYKEYSEGKSSMAIGRDIVKEGLIKDRNDICAKKWAIAILKDDVYTGDKNHPQIISKELKQQCEEIRSTFRSKSRNTVNNDWCLCKGLIRSLDNRYSYVTSAGGWGKYCMQSSHCIKIVYADSIVYNMAVEFDRNTPDDAGTIKNSYMIELSSATLKFNRSVSRRSELIAKKDMIWERNIEGKLSDIRAEQMSKATDKEINDCMDDILNYQNEIKRLNEMLANMHDENGELKEKNIDYDNLSVEEKKSLIRKYIKCVRLEHTDHAYNVIFHFDLTDDSEVVKKYYTRKMQEII